MENRRTDERLKTQTVVDVVINGERHVAQILDISGSGAYFETDANLLPGQTVTMVIRDEKTRIPAGVRRTDCSGYGVEFDDKSLGALLSGMAYTAPKRVARTS